MTTTENLRYTSTPEKQSNNTRNKRYSFGISNNDFALRKPWYNDSPFKLTNPIRVGSQSTVIEDTVESTEPKTDSTEKEDLLFEQSINNIDQSFILSIQVDDQIQETLQSIEMAHEEIDLLLARFDELLDIPKDEEDEKFHVEPTPTQFTQETQLPTPQYEQDTVRQQEFNNTNTQSHNKPNYPPSPDSITHSNLKNKEFSDEEQDYESSFEMNPQMPPFADQIRLKIRRIPDHSGDKPKVERLFEATLELFEDLKNEEVIQDQDSDEEEICTRVLGNIQTNFSKFVSSLQT